MSKGAPKLTSADVPGCLSTLSPPPQESSPRTEEEAAFMVAASEAQAEDESVRAAVGPEGEAHGHQPS